MKLLVGLGNPGSRYAATRHNIGFRVLDEVARRFPCQPLQSDAVVDVCQAVIDHCQVLLLKPQTYMNLSGIAVQRVVQDYAIASSDITVMYDDLDLEVGRLRIRKTGGHGGHKGVRSILEHLDTPAFVRLRMGIGRPNSTGVARDAETRDNIVEYVLHPFAETELPLMQQAVTHAVDAIRLIVADRVDAAMNTFNRSVESPALSAETNSRVSEGEWTNRRE